MKIPFSFLRTIPVLAMMGVIFLLSHQPGDFIRLPTILIIPGIDKIGHGVVFGLLAATVLWYCNIPGRIRIGGTPALSFLVTIAVKTVIFCVLYGISDEIHQYFVPHRSVSILDLLADLIGALIVSSVWLLIQKRYWKMIDTTREIQ